MNTSLTETDNIFPLLDAILKYVPEPKVNEGTTQMQITSLDYSSFLGRIAVGKVARGSVRDGQSISLVQADGGIKKMKIKELYTFEALGKKKATEVRLEHPSAEAFEWRHLIIHWSPDQEFVEIWEESA